MSTGFEFEKAAERLNDLLQSDSIRQLRGANEAETRLLLIDEVFVLLGWAKEGFHPEKQTTTGYTDYRLTIDGQPRLIVEAKRIGLVDSIPKIMRRADYSNDFLNRSCGQEMQLLLKQCRDYCSECGVPYAVATTGDMWVVLTGFKYGVEWAKLRSFVFHSLDDVAKQFNEFYSLISREAVRHNSLEEKFGSMALVKPSNAVRPCEYITGSPDIGSVPERQVIQTFFDRYMSDITHPGQDEMLAQCYVTSRQIDEFANELKRLLTYDAVLDEQERPIEELDEQKLEKELNLQAGSNISRTILLVGNVGSGKTTFVHRFIRVSSRYGRVG